MMKLTSPKSLKISISNGLLSLFLLFGVALRFCQFFSDRSLWVDEAALAKSILTRSFLGLLQNLDYNQVAPVGFVLIERFFVVLFGDSELILRLFPLICGLCSIFLFFHLCKNTTGFLSGIIGVFLFSTSKHLIYYSSEVKQYSSDVFSALICLLFFHQFTRRKLTIGFMTCMILVSILCVFLSQISVFVLVGISIGLFHHVLQRENRQKLFSLILFCFFWGTAFLLNYKFFLSQYQTPSGVIEFWQERNAFLPLDNFVKFVFWFSKAFQGTLNNPCGFPKQYIILPFMIVGVWHLWKKNRSLLISVIFMVLPAIAASSIKRFPFAERVVLYIVPIVLLLIAAGASWLIKSLWLRHKPGAIIIAFLLLWNPLFTGLRILKEPMKREEVKPLIAYIAQNSVANDRLYLYPSVKKAFEYYQTKYDLSKLSDIYLGKPEAEQMDYIRDIERFQGSPRVWFLFTHVWKGKEYDDRIFFINYLNQHGVLIDKFQSKGTWLYLYDLRNQRD